VTVLFWRGGLTIPPACLTWSPIKRLVRARPACLLSSSLEDGTTGAGALGGESSFSSSSSLSSSPSDEGVPGGEGLGNDGCSGGDGA